jgi:hypothetical protein
MAIIDLTRYIVASSGTWTHPEDDPLFQFKRSDTMAPERLLLRWAGDFVALTGPLLIRVTVQAENLTLPLAYIGRLPGQSSLGSGTMASVPGAAGEQATIDAPAVGRFAFEQVAQGRPLSLQASTIYSYTLDIAAGQAWPFSLSEQIAALRSQFASASRFEQLGNNLGFRVLIEPAFAVSRFTPVGRGVDLPCDFAVADHPGTASFFPVACEPCESSVIGLPPCDSVTLVTRPADGGCVRTRFFNGMFITREDLETEQRYHRLKSRLHNRAAGAGVVWGFNVGRQGDAVCVTPGYGVDCCGNDLALTTIYEVPIAALLADPAAAPIVCTRGPHRVHLLLEYVECPSDPRPVHADPCAPQTRCEMSRIRESVRLRLVPPRDYPVAKESGPIGRFLNEVNDLRKQFPLETGPAPAGTINQAPFSLQVTAAGRNNQLTTVTVPASADISAADLKSKYSQLFGPPFASITVEAVLDLGWGFSSGTVSGQALDANGAPIANAVAPAGTNDLASVHKIVFMVPPPTSSPTSAFAFVIAKWQAQTMFAGQDDPAPTGDLKLELTVNQDGVLQAGALNAAVAGVQPINVAPWPCTGEPCATGTGGNGGQPDCAGFAGSAAPGAADPTAWLPFLHADPVWPSRPGDPKALVLAALGGWLAQMLVRDRFGTTSEVKSARRLLAQEIYRITWVLLFGLSAKADQTALGNALKRLLEGWCCGLLWTGPECCGDPHGIVIGCAVVDGGTIQRIDPFGGRRWVIHYPLLEHWGAQFGIAPLDLTASRFFSKLCCISALPASGAPADQTPWRQIPIGNGMLLVGDLASPLVELKPLIASQRTVGVPEMIASVVTLLARPPSAAPPQPTPAPPAAPPETRFTALVLGEVVAEGTVMLLVPETP